MQINLWRSPSGQAPVYDFMIKQDPRAAARIMKDLDRLEKDGLRLLSDSHKLKKFKGYRNLYEIKTYFKGVFYRIIFTIVDGQAWMLDAFKKKSDDTPGRIIMRAAARQRLAAAG